SCHGEEEAMTTGLTPGERVVPEGIPHPLDPLSAAEISHATQLLRATGRLTTHMRLLAYCLQEPPKELVLASQPGERVPREVFVVIRDHERRVTIEAVVSLTLDRLRSWQERGDVQPALTYPEVFAAQQAILANADFQLALRRRGISEPSTVITYPFTAGYR